MYRYLFKKR